MQWLSIFLKASIRKRNIHNVYLTVLILAALFAIDPENDYVRGLLPWGATTVVQIINTLKVVVGVAMLHYSRKALFDYIDMGDLYEAVMKAPEEIRGIAAAVFACAVGLFAIAISTIISKAF